MLRPRLAAFAVAITIVSLAAPLTATPHGAQAAPPTTKTSYVVKEGDYLVGISLKLKVRLADLLAANAMTTSSVIHPGDTLVVPPTGAASTPPAPSKADVVIAFATAQAGKPYKFAAAGPDAFDCSGLVSAAFKQIGIKLPQYSVLQATYGTAVDWKAQPIVAGDLVFLADQATGTINHVGIAISSTQWIQAVRAGDVVRVGKMPTRIAAVRRIITG